MTKMVISPIMELHPSAAATLNSCNSLQLLKYNPEKCTKLIFLNLYRIYCIFGFGSGLKGKIEALIKIVRILHKFCCFLTFASI